ncbi:MAG: D-alanyl-D-alanine carboxypeptidase family protein, partial [Pseudomonadota bacterium]
EGVYLGYALEALDPFTDLLPPVATREVITGTESDRLAAAERLTDLGGFYAGLENGGYAAAGLLAAAYKTRLDVLSADHEDTVQTALLLGPVYERIGRLTDAEEVYLTAFHAQERARGSNNPELSLYIRLLSDIYRRQGRVTEAEALNVHMRTLFRDAFGARRYEANRNRDRTFDVSRPVSKDFPLPADYVPEDLVQASLFAIPTSKPPTIDEMKIRAAQIDTDITMPKMLADLVGECRSEEERLSLRSGYRSYKTQEVLYERSQNGKVTAPGTSEHQLGLAADIDVNGRLMRSTDRAFACFEAQAFKYGFILSYPRNNTYLDAVDGFEPWHWRFVGPQTALLYRELGPLGYPQEFLAALPCYEERALSGLFLNAGEEDICLATVMPDATIAQDEDGNAESAG